jgi:hypothetical protein
LNAVGGVNAGDTGANDDYIVAVGFGAVHDDGDEKTWRVEYDMLYIGITRLPRFHGDRRWGTFCTFGVADANYRTLHATYTSEIGEIISPPSLSKCD